MDEPTTNESGVRKYMIDVRIPPECMDENGGDCPHNRKAEKKQMNPV